MLIAAVWVSRDRMLGREEGQHVMRALAVQAAMEQASGAATVLRHSREDVKAHYGWPFYAATAVSWKLFGRGRVEALTVNAVSLLLLVAATARIARDVAGTGTAAPALLLLAASPAVLGAARFVSPALIVAAAVLLASALLLATQGFRRPWLALAAGLVISLCLMVKSGAFVFVLVPLATALTAGFRRPREAALGIALFTAGAAPGLAWSWIHRDVVYFWTTLLRELNPLAHDELWHRTAAVLAELWRPAEAIAIVGAAVFLLIRGTPRERRLAGLLALWALLPLVSIVLATGNPGTSRDHLASLVPIAVVGGLAARRVAPSARLAMCTTIVVTSLAASLGQRLDVGPSLLRRLDWTAAGSETGGQRRLPSEDHLATVAVALEGSGLSPESRCGCLPFPPYPVPGARDRPVLLLDAGDVGPENLEAWIRLRGRDPAWQLGLVPYGLGRGPFAVALDCASAIVLGPPIPALDVAPFGERQREQRPAVEAWGRQSGRIRLLASDELWLRRAVTPGLCQDPPVSSPLWSGAAADDFYLRHLEDLGRLVTDGPRKSSAAALARERARALREGEDPLATLFGELYLAEAVAQAGRHRSADEG